ncbi:MAG: protein phosphatase 2C domain-containing protein [Proteobacteria bacterium]|nr:protein phosphatase 2C domain-containing protein [Pseudomonadota bacterium]
MSTSPWRVAMASSIGQSHVAAAQPCQDAHFHLEAEDADGRPVMVLAAADGAGSAALAELGAKLACETFARLVETYVGKGGRVAAIERPLVERWITGLVYRIELDAKRSGARVQDYSCTLLAAVIADQSAAFVQIGDGAMVIPAGAGWRHVFWPQHGEFANTTNFVTSERAVPEMDFVRLDEAVQEVAVFTDGIENLVLQKASKTAHAPFFDSIFPPVRKSLVSGVDAELSQALEKYLSSPTINDRTDDDKTLMLASRRRA